MQVKTTMPPGATERPAVGRQLNLLPHSSPIDKVTWSSDGEHLISSEWDGGVKVWSPTEQQPVKTLNLHKERVRSGPVAESPDGKLIAGGDEESAVTVWDAQTGEALFCFRHRQQARPETRHPDGTVSYPGSWDTIMDLAFAADGEHLVSCGGDGAARVWKLDPQGGVRLVHTLEHEGLLVGSGAFAGDKILTRDKAGLHVFSLEDGSEVRTFSSQSGHGGLAVSPGGLAATVLDGKIVVVDPDQGTVLASSEELHGGQMTFSPDGKELFLGASIENVLSRWTWGSGEVREFPLGPSPNMPAATGVRGIAFAPTGQRMAVALMDYSLKLLATRQGLEDLVGEGEDRAQRIDWQDDWIVVGDFTLPANESY